MQRSLFLYPSALDRARDVLLAQVERTGGAFPESVDVMYAMRLVARAARGDGLALDIVRDDLAQLAVTVFGDGGRVTEVAANTMGAWAAEEYGVKPSLTSGRPRRPTNGGTFL